MGTFIVFKKIKSSFKNFIMKLTSFSLLISFVFVLISCGDNKGATSDKQEANTSSPEKKDNPASGLSAQGDDIIDEWDLVGAVVDTNDNLQIDEDERKKLESAAYKDYMKLNRDGS